MRTRCTQRCYAQPENLRHLHYSVCFVDQDLDDALTFYHATMPAPAFSTAISVAAICDALRGKASIHIIDIGATLALYMPSLLRQLASAGGVAPHVRVTVVDTSGFASRGLEQWRSLRAIAETSMRLRGLAQQLGVRLDLETVDIGQENLHLLYQVRATRAV